MADRSGPRIEPIADGPLRYRKGTDPEDRGTLKRADGSEIETRDTALLCRCGASARKPFCDGSHAGTDFTSARIWRPGPGEVMDHVGERITIHDNRRLCAHVEFCVQELPTVFDRGRRPWIDPDGASVEEIVALCDKCPSGALGYTIHGQEAVPRVRPATVIASREGPFFVEGDVTIVDPALPEGAPEEHCTLCRCGASRNKPLCDGKHWEVGFVDVED